MEKADATIMPGFITYTSFAAKQGALVNNGGGWNCTAFGNSCTQYASGGIYGPMTVNGRSGGVGEVSLEANINLADDEFAGATSMAYTIKWQAEADETSGRPFQVIISTEVDPDLFTDSLPTTAYNTGASATHSGKFNIRPTYINLRIGANITTSDEPGNGLTFRLSGLNFEIYDVVYGATSANTTLSALGSSQLSLSSNSSTSTVTSTTTPGEAISIQTMDPQSLPTSEYRSIFTSPSISPSSTSMSVTERAGVIAGALIGAGIVLLTIIFWYRRQKRRRMLHLEQVPSDDGISPDTRMANQEPLAPDPYLKRPYSRRTTISVNATLDRREVAEMGGIELTKPRRQNRRRRDGDGSTIHTLSLPPPAYSQLSPRLIT